MSVTQTMALNGASVNYATPLVLDLDGNGVRTLSIAAGVQFDIRGDGKKVATGWVDNNDGLLALDRNGDGIINDGGELFGSATTLADGTKAADGYAALAALDSNGDGRISEADGAYGALRVWVDGNSDGVSQADELKTLAQLGIATIATGAANALTQQNGNVIGLTSSYTGTDGSVHDSADVWFLAQKQATSATPAASLQQQVSGLSNALSSFSAANPATTGTGNAAQTQQLAALAATSAGAGNGVQALTDALKQYHAGQGLQGAAGALIGTHREPGGHSATSWFSVPNR
jgi:hypothetical protein